MRARVEKVDVLGWTKSNTVDEISLHETQKVSAVKEGPEFWNLIMIRMNFIRLIT